MMNRIPLTILATACLLSPIATAQSPHTSSAAFGLLQHDANQDGQLTRQEFTDGLAAQFARIDLDGDGTSTPGERETARDARRTEQVAERFAHLDTNNDGSISNEEFAARKEGRDGAQNRPRRAKAGPARMARNQPITWADFSTERLNRFDALDGNGDEVLSQAELHAASANR